MSATLEQAQQNFANYAAYHEHLRIQDYRTHEIIPLRLNRIQKRIYNRIVDARKQSRPCRLVILKARREGVSTLLQSVFAHHAFTRRDVHALTVSHEDDSTKKLHAMVERMYDYLPEPMRPEKKTGIRGKQLAFTHGSSLEVATAGGDGEVGRSGGYTRLHLSEMAQYPNAGTTWQGVVPTIPEEPGTIIVAESTAKGRVGRGQFFYELWQQAQEPGSSWEPLFFPWFVFDEYRQPVDERFAPTAEERLLRDRFELSLEQLAWRRHQIETYFANDPERFVEEYPATAEEAFLHSGRPFFQPAQTQRLRALAANRSYAFRGDLGSLGVFPERGAAARPEARADGRLRLLEVPERGHRYIVAVDPAGVLTAKEYQAFSDRSEARDYTAIVCVDRFTSRIVAYWHARIDNGLIGAEAAKIAKLYNQAMIVVETSGGYGAAALDWLRNRYSPLYLRTILDDQDRPITDEYGWLTSTQNRSRILEGLRDALRDEPHLIAVPELAAEMDEFVEGDSGKPAAAPGKHDDLVMATAIALEVVREYPQSRLVEDAA